MEVLRREIKVVLVIVVKLIYGDRNNSVIFVEEVLIGEG